MGCGWCLYATLSKIPAALWPSPRHPRRDPLPPTPPIPAPPTSEPSTGWPAGGAHRSCRNGSRPDAAAVRPPPSPGRGGEWAALLRALAICGAHRRRGWGGRCGCWQHGSVARRVGVVVQQRWTGGGGDAVAAGCLDVKGTRFFHSLAPWSAFSIFRHCGISSRHRQSRMGGGCGS